MTTPSECAVVFFSWRLLFRGGGHSQRPGLIGTGGQLWPVEGHHMPPFSATSQSNLFMCLFIVLACSTLPFMFCLAKWCGDRRVSVWFNLPSDLWSWWDSFWICGKRHLELLLGKPLKHTQFDVKSVGNQSLFCWFYECYCWKKNLICSEQICLAHLKIKWVLLKVIMDFEFGNAVVLFIYFFCTHFRAIIFNNRHRLRICSPSLSWGEKCITYHCSSAAVLNQKCWPYSQVIYCRWWPVFPHMLYYTAK